MKSEANTKSVEDLIADEKAYADSIREGFVAEAVAPADVSGVVHEAKSSSTADEFDAIVSRIKRK